MPKKERPDQWYILDKCRDRLTKKTSHCCRCEKDLTGEESVGVEIEWIRSYVRPDVDGEDTICVPCLTECKKYPVDHGPIDSLTSGRARRNENVVIFYRPGHKSEKPTRRT